MLLSKHLWKYDWKSIYMKRHCCIDPMTRLVSHQAAPHILQQNCAMGAHVRIMHPMIVHKCHGSFDSITNTVLLSSVVGNTAFSGRV